MFPPPRLFRHAIPAMVVGSAVTAALVRKRVALQRFGRLATLFVMEKLGDQVYRLMQRTQSSSGSGACIHAIMRYSWPAKVPVTNGRGKGHTLERNGFELSALPLRSSVLTSSEN